MMASSLTFYSLNNVQNGRIKILIFKTAKSQQLSVRGAGVRFEQRHRCHQLVISENKRALNVMILFLNQLLEFHFHPVPKNRAICQAILALFLSQETSLYDTQFIYMYCSETLGYILKFKRKSARL